MDRNNTNFLSLASRLSIGILLGGVLVFTAVLGSNYFLSRNLLEEYVTRLALETVGKTALRIDSIFASVGSDARSLAAIVTNTGVDAEQIDASIHDFVRANPEIYGMTVALEPHVLLKEIGEYAPYYFKRGNGLAFADLADPNYNYRTWAWYTEPREKGREIWSEPYIDTGGGEILMTTISVPIRVGNTFAGVATADIELDWLESIVNDIAIGKTGQGFIVSQSDVVIAHADQQHNMRPLKDVLGERVVRSWRPYFDRQGNIDTLVFKAPCSHYAGLCQVVIDAIQDTGWKVVIEIPDQELRNDIRVLTTKIAAIAAVGLILLAITIVAVSRYLTRPLGQLARATREIGSGNLDVELPDPARLDEIGLLTGDFNVMRDSLRRYIDELTDATTRKQKLESEIQIAQGIQMSMVPGFGDAHVLTDHYHVFACLHAARLVGGDLYFFQEEDGILHFLIGDVSDKGVPAALFMAKAVTLYTSAMSDGLSPGAVFERLNESLCQNNDACMFVTALCGVLDLSNGRVTMSNAGHMNPILKKHSAVIEQEVDGGLALGLMEETKYAETSFDLESGTRIITYTDGISEAFDEQCEQYGEERLFALLRESGELDVEQLGQRLLDDVAGFVGNAQQSDDITLLFLGWH